MKTWTEGERKGREKGGRGGGRETERERDLNLHSIPCSDIRDGPASLFLHILVGTTESSE